MITRYFLCKTCDEIYKIVSEPQWRVESACGKCTTMNVELVAKLMHEEQPMPVKNNHPIIQDLVLADIQKRKELGIERYGTGLQPFNGRDFLRDGYEESMDLLMYLRGEMYQRDGK